MTITAIYPRKSPDQNIGNAVAGGGTEQRPPGQGG